jgi:hypothetical protein
MRTTIHPDAVDQPPPTRWLDRLRRVFARRGAETVLEQAGQPTARREWREVAPGEWRWLHLPEQAAPR